MRHVTLIVVIAAFLAGSHVDAILETFVNYIYWGPSGYTARVGVCPGGDAPGSVLTLTSADECAERCNAARANSTLGCVGFTFSPSVKRCSLKIKSCGSTVVNGPTDTSMMYDIYDLDGVGCPVGFFGWNCSYYCSCANNEVCNPVDGTCPSGCSDHHWGWGCSLINTCFYDDEGGSHYKGSRYNSISGAMCQPWHQRTPHNHNLTDSNVPDGSLQSARNFCRNPRSSNGSSPIGATPNEPWCYVLDKPGAERETCYVKKCSCEFGRYGTNCEKECPEGRYGQDCRFQCACNADETCSKLTGKCQKCPPGYFGSGCLRRCHCRDDSEVCDYRSGACTQCAEGFGGNDCYTKLPFLSKQPWVSKRTPSSLTLAWENWFECNANDGCGEGPIEGYIVEYHPKNAQIHKWIQAVVSSNTTEVEFTHLHDDVIYELRVTPIHSRWLQGVATIPLDFQLCGDPKTAPEPLKFGTPTCSEGFCKVDVGFNKIGDLSSLNCDSSKVSYVLSFAHAGQSNAKSAYQSLTCPPSSEKSCEMTLTQLQPGVMYNLKVCASSAKSVPMFWKYLSETMLDKTCGPVYDTSIQMPFAEPSEPRNLSIDRLESRRVSLKWDPPSQTNSPESSIFYSVEVKENVVKSCGKMLNAQPRYLVANKTWILIDSLTPYSEYTVTIFANNGGHRSKLSAWLQFTTLPTLPDSKLAVRISSIGPDYVQVAIDEPNCLQSNGEMTGFFYQLSLSSNSSGTDLISGTSSESQFRVSRLEPYSYYVLTVSLVNIRGRGPGSPPIKFRTTETVPARPKTLEINNVTHDSVKVSVVLSSRPRANVRFIEVKVADLQTVKDIKSGAKSEPKSEVLKILTDSASNLLIPNLKPNSKYRIQARSVADSGSSAWSDAILVKTKRSHDGVVLEDAMAVYDSPTFESMPLVAGIIVSVLLISVLFAGVGAIFVIRRRRISRTMVPSTGSSLSRSCTSGGSSTPSSSTAADDVQGRWRTIPHFLQEMKSESMIYTTHDVIGLCDTSPPSTFINTDGASRTSSSSASPDSSHQAPGFGLLRKALAGPPPVPPPRPPALRSRPA